MSTVERERKTALLAAIRAALDDPSLGLKNGTVSEKSARHHVLLLDEDLHPGDTKTLVKERDRIAGRLYGDRPPARPVDTFSIIDPNTGVMSRTRVLIPAVLFVGGGALLGANMDSLLAFLCVVAGAAVIFGAATYRVVADGLRLTSSRLESGDVVTISPGAMSYPLARTVTANVATLMSVSRGRSDDDNADLLAERDRIVAEIVELDSRSARLGAIASDTDGANASDHARLVEDVQYWYRQLDRDAHEISKRADSVRASIATDERERRRARAREELDDLAAPPPGLIQNTTWTRKDSGSRRWGGSDATEADRP